ncbi:unnamed protein product [Nesidiocoris tenuis]|uniref:Reticulon-like protein n=1 Tax=Nesidiocoris tenuis TaxID=355587 RepID=A0A6H5GQH9_9HEMI|nr:unnamed protein product [Nesidiocoris tenuis]
MDKPEGHSELGLTETDLLGYDPDSPSRGLSETASKETNRFLDELMSDAINILPNVGTAEPPKGADKSALDDFDFGFEKPLPPEPAVTVDFIKSESLADNMFGQKVKGDEEKSRTPSPVPPRKETPSPVPPREETPSPVSLRKETPSPVPLRKETPSPVPPMKETPSPVPPRRETPSPVPPREETPSPVPPPVPKHQTPPAQDEDELYEPTQTPEPEEFKPMEPAPKASAPPSEPAPIASRPRQPTPSPPRSPPPVAVKETRTADDIGAQDIRSKLYAWFNPARLHPAVEALLYWRDPKKSGVVFGVTLLTLLSLTAFSLISVVAYLCLFTLGGTICFRIYKSIMQAVQKTSDGHPFKDILELDLTIPEDKVNEIGKDVVKYVNSTIATLRSLFLVEDLIDSIKFLVLSWVLTYIGACFNGLTLIIIGVILLFTLPTVYEKNQAQIDVYVKIAMDKLSIITNKMKAAVPEGKKEEKKDQ